jgi:hypothetical protein
LGIVGWDVLEGGVAMHFLGEDPKVHVAKAKSTALHITIEKLELTMMI